MIGICNTTFNTSDSAMLGKRGCLERHRMFVSSALDAVQCSAVLRCTIPQTVLGSLREGVPGRAEQAPRDQARASIAGV